LICSEIYNNFDFYEDQLKLSHHSNISRHAYRNKKVHGNQWATSTQISVILPEFGEFKLFCGGLNCP
jgi:hypothetical protein